MFPPLYAILDRAPDQRPREPYHRDARRRGRHLIQIRDKQAPPARFMQAANRLVLQFASRSVRIIVNDRPDIAAMVGAGGVHVGQEDLPVAEARKLVGPDRWVGVSTHNIEQLRDAPSLLQRTI